MNEVNDKIYQLVESHTLSPKDAAMILRSLKEPQTEEIAVIGMSCRFQDVEKKEDFWNVLKDGKNLVSHFPDSRRKDIEELLNAMGISADSLSMGTYLNEIDQFDAGFFKLSPTEARLMDPVQRIMLETAYHAMEDAGYGGNLLYGSNTGVYIGHDHTGGLEYKEYFINDDNPVGLTGSYTGILSSRISYLMNLTGPSVVLDTACSSGMTAIHTACSALLRKDCNMAVAGGISIKILPLDDGALRVVESGNQEVRTFDHKANGTVWGEGAAAILLKPLKEAERDGDHIYAVIKSSVLNNDGASNGITAPNADAQQKAIEKAWKLAGIDPETISYVESHGTGTVLGDPIEIKAITKAFRKYTDKKQFCGIGSVKTNLGHLIACSGIASFIKVVLAMEHKQIPPSIHFEYPNEHIDFANSPVYVNERLKEWKSDKARRAGVSCFGFSGTNCHIVLEEYTKNPAGQQKEQNVFLFPFSAKTKEGVMRLLEEYARYFTEEKEHPNLAHVSYTLCTGRGHYGYRIAILASSVEELRYKLNLAYEHPGGREDKDIFYQGPGEVTDRKQWPAWKENAATLVWKKTREYLSGEENDWEELFTDEEKRKISLPGYPFERVRQWTESGITRQDSAKKTQNLHLLLEECLADSLEQTIYETVYRVDKQWVLAEHKVKNHNILPGTACIEMILQAAKRYYKTEQVVIQNFVILAPVIVGEEEDFRLQLILKKGTEKCQVILASRNEEREEEWITHVVCEVYPNTQSMKKRNLSELLVTCKEKQSNREEEKNDTFYLGERWNNIKALYLGEQELLLELGLPTALKEEVKDYITYPSLLDNAVNIAIRKLGDGLYLPFSYGKFSVYQCMPAHFYSYVRTSQPLKRNQDAVTFQIDLIAESGVVFATAEDYMIKRIDKDIFQKSALTKTAYFYETEWRQVEDEKVIPNGARKSLLLLSDNREQSVRWKTALEENGQTVRAVLQRDEETGITCSQEAYQKLADSVLLDEIDQIIYLQCGEDITEEENRVQDIKHIFYFLKAMMQSRKREKSRISIVTENAYDITGTERIRPMNAAILAFCRCADAENPNLGIQCIDQDRESNLESIQPRLLWNIGGNRIAFRDSHCYEEVVERKKFTQERDLPVKEHGIYVITGGTGGIGTQLAKYLSSVGKVTICMLSRSGRPKPEEVYEEIRNSGSRIEFYQADCRKREQMKAVLGEIRKQGRICGVIHCAGVEGEQYILTKDYEKAQHVLEPKIIGISILDELTREDQPDFFVSCSSYITLLGMQGQSDYCAANEYLNAYTRWQRKQGVNAIAINWPAWSETGMAFRHHITESTLCSSIENETGVLYFDRILKSNQSAVFYPITLDYEFILHAGERVEFGIGNELQQELNQFVQKKKADGKPKEKEMQKKVKLTGRNNQSYTSIEQELALIWGNTLGVSEIRIDDPFVNMGGNSLLATKMIQDINKKFPDKLNITDIFTLPTVEQMAAYLEEEINQERQAESKKPEEETANEEETDFVALLKKIKSDDISVEDGLKALSGERQDE